MKGVSSHLYPSVLQIVISRVSCVQKCLDSLITGGFRSTLETYTLSILMGRYGRECMREMEAFTLSTIECGGEREGEVRESVCEHAQRGEGERGGCVIVPIRVCAQVIMKVTNLMPYLMTWLKQDLSQVSECVYVCVCVRVRVCVYLAPSPTSYVVCVWTLRVVSLLSVCLCTLGVYVSVCRLIALVLPGL